MNLLFILSSFFTFSLKGYLAIGIPTGDSKTLLKGGGTVGLEATVYEGKIISAGASLESSSFVLLGSGNSEIKLLSLAPVIFIRPPLPGDALIIKGMVKITRFQIHNPSYTRINYTTGSTFGSDIKITEKPLKLYLTAHYSTYQGIKKNFSFYNLGLALRI